MLLLASFSLRPHFHGTGAVGPSGFLFGFVCVGRGGEGWGEYEITTASFNAKISSYMYKKIYICKHILLYNNYTLYAYLIMDIIMHICILYFIYFNKHYMVHLNVCSDILFSTQAVIYFCISYNA